MDIIIELDDKIQLNGNERIEYIDDNKLVIHMMDKKLVYRIEECLSSYIAVYDEKERYLINHVGKREE
ncbi:hypothetical protein THOM_1786 [Trachipleistophora hominis]|uniref:Uncharacterized protein n=1 Tax=Trachipleistophora hominis TaxID=72359 RepID=L7JV45_TRAHO|nr:hypothetical protein THOM_1786 [Trachipleistophora hominis]